MGILSLSSLSASAGRNHYRWIDERGNPVHSDRPPPKGIDYEVVSTGSSLVRQVSAEEGVVPTEVVPRVGNDFEQVDTAKQAIEKIPEYCERARLNIQSLDTHARIRVRNEQGEYHWLSQEEKDAQRLQAEATIATHCD
jgi:hypothetical protein